LREEQDLHSFQAYFGDGPVFALTKHYTSERGNLDDEPQNRQLPRGIVFAVEGKQAAVAMAQGIAGVDLLLSPPRCVTF